jgi:hypothetical protein
MLILVKIWSRLDFGQNFFNGFWNLFDGIIGMFVMSLWVCIHTGQAEKFAWPRWESNTNTHKYHILKNSLIIHEENTKEMNV